MFKGWEQTPACLLNCYDLSALTPCPVYQALWLSDRSETLLLLKSSCVWTRSQIITDNKICSKIYLKFPKLCDFRSKLRQRRRLRRRPSRPRRPPQGPRIRGIRIQTATATLPSIITGDTHPQGRPITTITRHTQVAHRVGPQDHPIQTDDLLLIQVRKCAWKIKESVQDQTYNLTNDVRDTFLVMSSAYYDRTCLWSADIFTSVWQENFLFL